MQNRGNIYEKRENRDFEHPLRKILDTPMNPTGRWWKWEAF